MASVTERQERYRKGRRERGQCGWSACTEQSGDEYYCPEHREAHRQRMQRNRASMPRGKKKEWLAARRVADLNREQARRDAGLCPHCGDVPESPYVMCGPCRGLYSAWQRKRRQKAGEAA